MWKDLLCISLLLCNTYRWIDLCFQIGAANYKVFLNLELIRFVSIYVGIHNLHLDILNILAHKIVITSIKLHGELTNTLHSICVILLLFECFCALPPFIHACIYSCPERIYTINIVNQVSNVTWIIFIVSYLIFNGFHSIFVPY